MIEITIYDYLTDYFADSDVSVHMQEPSAEMKGNYIVIEKTGGGELNYIKSATFALKSYGDSLYSAAALNEKLKEAIFKITEIDETGVSKATLNSDYNFTDTTKKKFRYQAVFDFSYTE